MEISISLRSIKELDFSFRILVSHFQNDLILTSNSNIYTLGRPPIRDIFLNVFWKVAPIL